RDDRRAPLRGRSELACVSRAPNPRSAGGGGAGGAVLRRAPLLRGGWRGVGGNTPWPHPNIYPFLGCWVFWLFGVLGWLLLCVLRRLWLLWLLWLLSRCPSCLAMNLILDKGDEYMDAPPAGWRVKFRDAPR